MKKNFTLFLCSLFFSVLLIEVGLRLSWTNPFAGSGTDTILKLRIHHKNIDQQVDRSLIDDQVPYVPYRTNQRSYLEPAFRYEEPDFTIAFLGGSTTECIIVQEAQRFPARVSSLLQEEGLSVNTLNAARSGGTLHDSINILLNHVIQEHPDVVVLMHAVNDIGVLQRDGDYRSRMGEQVRNVDILKYLSQMASSHSSLAGFLRKSLMKISGGPDQRGAILFSQNKINNPEPFRIRLKIFIGICRAMGAVPILVTQPHAGNIRNTWTPSWVNPNAQDAFNQIIRDVGEKTHTEVIDLATYMAARTRNEEELNRIFYDGIHVTDAGSSMYAEYMVDRLRKVLQAWIGKSQP